MFGFNKYRKHIVTIIKDGEEIGDGILRFGNGKGIFIATNFTKDLSQHFDKDKTKNHLKLKTKRKTFTVINCTYEHSTIFADAILKGSTHPSEFLKIFIRYEKISEWFSPNKLNHEKNESETTIKWMGNTDHFQSIINCKSGEYLISSEQGYNTQHKTDKAIINNYTWFCIECTNGQFNFQEMRTKSHHLLTFFSIITGYPTQIIGAQIETKEGYSEDIYFQSMRSKQDNEENPYLSINFMQSRMASALKLYLENMVADCPVTWLNFSGMKNYTGFWEYEVSGHIYLLEPYLEHAASQATIEKEPTRTSKIRTALLEEIKKYEKHIDIKEMKSLVLELKNGKEITINSLFSHLMSKIDSVISEILQISTDDFNLILETRHAISHGSPHNISGNKFQKISEVLDKIKILITCCAYYEMGMGWDAGKEFILNSRSLILRSANLNEIKREIASGRAREIITDRDTFESASMLDSVFIKTDSEYKLSKEMSIEREKWRKKGVSSQLKDYMIEIGLWKDEYRFEFPHTIYLIYEGEIKEVIAPTIVLI